MEDQSDDEYFTSSENEADHFEVLECGRSLKLLHGGYIYLKDKTVSSTFFSYDGMFL